MKNVAMFLKIVLETTKGCPRPMKGIRENKFVVFLCRKSLKMGCFKLKPFKELSTTGNIFIVHDITTKPHFKDLDFHFIKMIYLLVC